ncbi:MAG: Slp family lipoprotein [Kangiellaceae bacterium]|jgi:outer membrane lipoprotein|nr:Slp family lipoprotein [Kangiellaceae bacterium]
MKAISILLVLFFLAGCNSIPKHIRGEYPAVSVQKARAMKEQPVLRWGGVIASIKNEKEHSVVEIVAKPLGSSSRPLMTDKTEGRFLALINGFVDPLIYQRGREITVVGKLTETIDGKIGEMEYKFPIINVQAYQLWSRRVENRNRSWFFYSPGFWPGFGPWIRPYPFIVHPRIIQPRPVIAVDNQQPRRATTKPRVKNVRPATVKPRVRAPKPTRGRRVK